MTTSVTDNLNASRDGAEGRRNTVFASFACAGIVAMTLMAVANRSSWSVDFTQFYTAGSLVGTGHLFDWPTIQALELRRGSTAVPFIRLPVFAFAFKPLSALPYPVARVLFLFIEIGALAGFVALWPFPRRNRAWLAVCWSVPAATC